MVLRRTLGDVLRQYRVRQGRTLRQVSGAARVSLGYLSEVERGQKEASSELLESICDALDTRMSDVLRDVSDLLVLEEAARGLRAAPEPVASTVPALVPAGAPAGEPADRPLAGVGGVVDVAA